MKIQLKPRRKYKYLICTLAISYDVSMMYDHYEERLLVAIIVVFTFRILELHNCTTKSHSSIYHLSSSLVNFHRFLLYYNYN